MNAPKYQNGVINERLGEQKSAKVPFHHTKTTAQCQPRVLIVSNPPQKVPGQNSQQG
jgi:hypothetical protein